MPEAVIVDAVRTPIGRAVKGSFRHVRADDLAAVPLAALVERNPDVDFAQTDDIMMGCGFGEGEQGYNVGRNAGLLAGIDHHVPATTVNRFCASSLQTLRMAFHAIHVGEGDQYVAAGVEAVSRAGGGANFEFHPKLDGSENSLYNVYIPMGLTAENVAERCNVSREAQDEWAVVSQNRAVDAQESGHFDKEIVPVDTPAATETDKEGNEVHVEAGTMTNDDIDVLELNEAFAAQVVPCKEEWGIDDEKLNPHGGAIALGHPFGMTGARIMTTLLNDLETLDQTIGLETMCVAGGMGQAM